MGHQDDRQKEEVYCAERAVRWSEFGANETLDDLHDVWSFVNRLMSRQSFARHYQYTHHMRSLPAKTKPVKYGYGENMFVAGPDSNFSWQNGLIIMPYNHGGVANGRYIKLSKWARQKFVIIHELSHVVDYNENGRPRYIYHQGHGWQFCAIFLRLTGMAFGNEAKKALRSQFQKHGVKYLQPKTLRTARHPKELDDCWKI